MLFSSFGAIIQIKSESKVVPDEEQHSDFVALRLIGIADTTAQNGEVETAGSYNSKCFT